MSRLVAHLGALGVALCAFFGVAAERPAPALAAPEQGVVMPKRPQRVCFGGLEDGKTIVRGGHVIDGATQTTASACRIDGGGAVRSPQSPVIAAKRDAVV